MRDLHLFPHLHDDSSYTQVAQTDALVAGVVLVYLAYTGPAQPVDPEARYALRRAYRSELLLRYAAWAARHLPPLTEPVTLRYRELRLWLPHFIYDEEEGLPSAEPLFHDMHMRLDQWHDLVLLGPPGSGKTTTAWRLARDLARDGLAGDERTPLPLIVDLGAYLSGRDARGLLRDELEHAVVPTWDGGQQPLAAHRLMVHLLPDLLAEERLVIMWDGLDETRRGLAGQTGAMIEELRRGAVRRILNVVTCRSGAYPATGLHGKGLHVTVKQAATEPLDEPEAHSLALRWLGDERGRAMMALLERPTYGALARAARSPLLLGMLCEIYAAYGELPTSRGRLLKALVAARIAGVEPGTSEGRGPLALLERALGRLAFELTAIHGRGSAVPHDWAVQQLGAGDDAQPSDAPPTLGRSPAPEQQPIVMADPAGLLHLALAAGLLASVGDRGMVRFSHTVIQDYFAAVALGWQMAEAEGAPIASLEPAQLGRYPEPGWQRGWEDTLLLLASLDGAGGPLRRRLGEAMAAIPLAAARAIDADPSTVEPEVLWLVRDVARELVADTGRSVRQRLDAGAALGLIEDPRTPLSLQAWSDTLISRGKRFGQTDGYWCYVRPGTYRIGGWADGQEGADVILDAFWIGRFPVTVAQFSRFVAEGYDAGAERWWAPQGWAWRLKSRRTEPQHWADPQYTALSQPVVGVSWYEAAAYCAWLSEGLRDVLPLGLVMRLPTEVEWEVAAAFDGEGIRRPYPWGHAAPTVELAIFSASRQTAPAPVGCCPAGAAACGALDILGNVEEWCASWYGAYPDGSGRVVDDPPSGKGVVLGPLGQRQLPVRGGWWANDAAQLGCWSRFWHEASAASYNTGFRFVLAAPGGAGPGLA